MFTIIAAGNRFDINLFLWLSSLRIQKIKFYFSKLYIEIHTQWLVPFYRISLQLYKCNSFFCNLTCLFGPDINFLVVQRYNELFLGNTILRHAGHWRSSYEWQTGHGRSLSMLQESAESSHRTGLAVRYTCPSWNSSTHFQLLAHSLHWFQILPTITYPPLLKA